MWHLNLAPHVELSCVVAGRGVMSLIGVFGSVCLGCNSTVGVDAERTAPDTMIEIGDRDAALRFNIEVIDAQAMDMLDVQLDAVLHVDIEVIDGE